MVRVSAPAADRVCDCGDGVQWPKERKPKSFMGIVGGWALRTEAGSFRTYQEREKGE